MELTKQEKELLEKIMNDPRSVGAFCGMCTNLTMTLQGQRIAKTPEQVIKHALEIRIIAENMCECGSVMTGQGPDAQQRDSSRPGSVLTCPKESEKVRDKDLEGF